MRFNYFREKSLWLSQISGILFLVISVYMQSKFVFESGNFAGTLLLIAVISALLTFFFGMLSLPRWQGFVALTISLYAGYWLGFCPTYAVS